MGLNRRPGVSVGGISLRPDAATSAWKQKHYLTARKWPEPTSPKPAQRAKFISQGP